MGQEASVPRNNGSDDITSNNHPASHPQGGGRVVVSTPNNNVAVDHFNANGADHRVVSPSSLDAGGGGGGGNVSLAERPYWPTTPPSQQ
eukprot:CAMPEP_0196146858 /NCGR_PEP_ID=MMETSP0910-20130528/24019_1 /TAXON_ID=49265 /ORGANISM="Thalassiosira rotula, Strain GSO102" /LENGTH=88 /DNA_ID=CAMNT_0041409131 /DNA_START=33 /DNA_END=296 /DNA_ORIENTATION=+